MTDHSRRTFLKHASIGAAAVGATTAIPAINSSAQAAPERDEAGPAYHGPFTVWIKDARTGEIAVLVGEREVVHHDRVLARKLAKIAARG
jgi:hypothetical protein